MEHEIVWGYIGFQFLVVWELCRKTRVMSINILQSLIDEYVSY